MDHLESNANEILDMSIKEPCKDAVFPTIPEALEKLKNMCKSNKIIMNRSEFRVKETQALRKWLAEIIQE